MANEQKLVAPANDVLWYQVQSVNLLNQGRSATSDELERIRGELRQLVATTFAAGRKSVKSK
jgi:hypothetical protein